MCLQNTSMGSATKLMNFFERRENKKAFKSYDLKAFGSI